MLRIFDVLSSGLWPIQGHFDFIQVETKEKKFKIKNQ